MSPDEAFLARVRRELIQCLWVAILEGDAFLATLLQEELAKLRDPSRFRRARFDIIAPGQPAAKAAMELFLILIVKAREIEDRYRQTMGNKKAPGDGPRGDVT